MTSNVASSGGKRDVVPKRQAGAGTPMVALAIAGLDPSGGAGIMADLKTFAAHRIYGVCCATALTVQSTLGVRRVVPVEGRLVAETLEYLATDTPPAGIKIGMLANAEVAVAVADFLQASDLQAEAIVLDPVVCSSSGKRLLDAGGLRVLRERLLGRVGWVTPNLDELAALLDEPVARMEGIPTQAARLQLRTGNGGLRVVVTGGHLEKPHDYFLDEDGRGEWIAGERVETSSTHGTGCAFASALLCQVLSGARGRDAVAGAKAYVTAALKSAYPMGQGKGPMHHLFALDERGKP